MPLQKKLIVTGCLGFMGSHFTRACLARGWRVFGVDKITYAARTSNLDEFARDPLFKFEKADICALTHLTDADIIVNFAAETHVDNSITDSAHFIQTNICGVGNLLELVRAKTPDAMSLFVQISTDEVYGDIEAGEHTEEDRLNPSNPYSSSKAAADMMVLGWNRTYGIDYVIVRPTNNYGVDQYPEKLIPKCIEYLKSGKRMTMYGNGENRRTWLHVDDMVDGVMAVIDKGARNTIYNLSGSCEWKNREVLRKIIHYYFDGKEDASWEDHIKANCVRPGEDVRYSLRDERARALGWEPARDFDEELKQIVDFHKQNFIW